MIGASAKDQAAYLEEYIIGQLDRFEDARNYPRVKQANDTLNDGLSWFLTDKDGGKIDAFSGTQTLKDQPVIKAVNEATSYKDPRTGEVFTLDELHGKAFVGSGKVNISPEDLTLDLTSRKGKKAFKLIEDHGGYRLRQVIPGALKPVIGIGGKLVKPVGALLDAGSAFAGTTGALDENKTGLQKTASALDATSGALGLGSLVAPALGPLSVGAGIFAAGDQTAPDIANAVAPYVPTPTLYSNENSTGDVGRDAGIAISNAAESVKDFVTQDFGITELAERTTKRGIEWIRGIPRFAITY